jgi:hypothetical protein
MKLLPLLVGQRSIASGVLLLAAVNKKLNLMD